MGTTTSNVALLRFAALVILFLFFNPNLASIVGGCRRYLKTGKEKKALLLLREQPDFRRGVDPNRTAPSVSNYQERYFSCLSLIWGLMSIMQLGGNTLLHYAALNAMSEVIAELLALGGDPNIRNDRGENSLFACVSELKQQSFEVFLIYFLSVKFRFLKT